MLSRRPLKISGLVLILKRGKENTLTCICLFSYVTENNLSWKVPLEVCPTLCSKLGYFVKILKVVQCHITEMLNG